MDGIVVVLRLLPPKEDILGMVTAEGPDVVRPLLELPSPFVYQGSEPGHHTCVSHWKIAPVMGTQNCTRRGSVVKSKKKNRKLDPLFFILVVKDPLRYGPFCKGRRTLH